MMYNASSLPIACKSQYVKALMLAFDLPIGFFVVMLKFSPKTSPFPGEKCKV